MKKAWLSYWNHDSYTKALNSNPDIVVIQLGTNDAFVNWSDEIEKMFINDYVELIKSFINLPSKPDVYVMIPPAISMFAGYESQVTYKWLEGIKVDKSIDMGLGGWENFEYNINVRFPHLIPEIARKANRHKNKFNRQF